MATQTDLLQVYLELVEIYEQHGQPQMRDRFLLLAADAAVAAGRADQAERLRQRFLEANPHHIIKPYASISQALVAPAVQTYIANLRRNYPLEVAVDLLRTLKKQGSRGLPQSDHTVRADEDLEEDTLAIPERSTSPSPKARPGRDVGEPTEDVGQTAPLASWFPSAKVHFPGTDEDDSTEAIPPTLPPQRKPRSPRVPESHSPVNTAPLNAAPPLSGTGRSATAPPPAAAHGPSRNSGPLPHASGGRHRNERETAHEEPEGGGVLALLLFVVVIGAGLLLLGYTMARPFLP